MTSKNRLIAIDIKCFDNIIEVYNLRVLAHFGPKNHTRKIDKVYKDI